MAIRLDSLVDQLDKLVSSALPPEERVVRVVGQALDEALRLYVVNLFTMAMRDPSGQPERALTGIKKATTAWYRAVVALQQGDLIPKQPDA